MMAPDAARFYSTEEPSALMDLYTHPEDDGQVEDAARPAFQNNTDILAWCVSVLSLSPACRMMLREAAGHGWHVVLGDLGKHDFHLDVPERLIVLNQSGMSFISLSNSGYFRNALLVSFTRALRDVWQEKRHGGFDEHYGPDEILMLERVRAADCDVVSILVAWELRGAGSPELWRHMIGSEEGDMAMAFSMHMERDPSSVFTGAALSAAFNQWYLSEDRINACDHETLEYLDNLISDHGGPGIFGDKKLTRIGVEVLSCLPDKTAYLRGLGGNILADPRYYGMCDPINQAHYMHIVRDAELTYAGNVAFRDAALAARIFPEGSFEGEFEEFSSRS